jgi:hypothetical protein
VIGTGDTVGFNTVYRDRNVLWPIQDFPFSLVFFAHRNPVDESAGFQPGTGQPEDPNPYGEAQEATSTDSLLLNRDIVETLAQAAWSDNGVAASAAQLREGFRHTVWRSDKGCVAVNREGPALFDATGNRRPGTGEHIIWLMPHREGPGPFPLADVRVPSQATITVWPLPDGWQPGQRWSREPSRTYRVTYDDHTEKGAGRDDK